MASAQGTVGGGPNPPPRGKGHFCEGSYPGTLPVLALQRSVLSTLFAWEAGSSVRRCGLLATITVATDTVCSVYANGDDINPARRVTLPRRILQC